MIVTSSKQSRRHSKLLMIDPKLGSLTYSQSQKHSLLPPVVRPHIGSFSNLGLGAGNKVLPKYSYVTLVFIILSIFYHWPIKFAASWPVRAVSATNIITASWGIPSVPCLSQSSSSSNIALYIRHVNNVRQCSQISVPTIRDNLFEHCSLFCRILMYERNRYCLQSTIHIVGHIFSQVV